jgi:hypothetical protein
MPDSNQELERLKRLRERQLAERDPHVKQRQFQHMTAQREQKYRKPYSFGKMWSDIPHTWKGFFYGAILGTIVLLVLPLFWASPWAIPCSAMAIVVFAMFGVVLGRAIDSRENIKDLMR